MNWLPFDQLSDGLVTYGYLRHDISLTLLNLKLFYIAESVFITCLVSQLLSNMWAKGFEADILFYQRV